MFSHGSIGFESLAHGHTRLSKSGHQICHTVPLSRAHLVIGAKVGLCVFVSVCVCETVGVITLFLSVSILL